jgi:hypothetical protein
MKRLFNARAFVPFLLIVFTVTGMAAQTVPASSPGKSGTHLITLGTRAGPIPIIGRAQSSNVLMVNGAAVASNEAWEILVECPVILTL